MHLNLHSPLIGQHSAGVETPTFLHSFSIFPERTLWESLQIRFWPADLFLAGSCADTHTRCGWIARLVCGL